MKTKFQSEIDAEEDARLNKEEQPTHKGEIVEEWEEVCGKCNEIKERFELCCYCENIDTENEWWM